MKPDEILRKNIKWLLDINSSKKSSIENKMGLSTGYFARLLKYDRIPDMKVLFAISDFFKIDYNTLLTVDLAELEGEKTSEYYIFQFISWLCKESISKNSLIKWVKRTCLSNTFTTAGMRIGYYKEYSMVGKKHYEGTLSGGSVVNIYEIEDADENRDIHYYYEVDMDDRLLYSTKTKKSEESEEFPVIKVLNSLIMTLDCVTDNSISTAHWRASADTIEIIKKYINEN